MSVLLTLSCALLSSALRVQQSVENGPNMAAFDEREHLQSNYYAPWGANPRICIQNVWIGNLTGNWLKNYERFDAYAKKHGYDHHLLKQVVDRKGRSSKMIPTWQKVPLTLALMTKINAPCDYVMQMDMDAMITNDEIKIESLIEKAPKANIILNGDTNVVNAGQSLWKNSEFTMDFLNDMWATGVEPPKLPGMQGDNAALSIMLGGCDPSQAKKKLERNDCYRKMNKGWEDADIQARTERADPKVFAEVGVPAHLLENIAWIPKKMMNSYMRDYTDGDFVLHMAGLNKHRKTYVMATNLASLQAKRAFIVTDELKKEQEDGLKLLNQGLLEEETSEQSQMTLASW